MDTQIVKNKLSPMMQKYCETKEQYPDAILFYRLGDFYEMFFEDAQIASKILELTLTGKDCGLEKRAPMCGVPHHAAKNYIAKLVEYGYKVAICEQLTEPGDQKGLVERAVVQVVTPGTILDNDALDSTTNNFLMYIYSQNSVIGVCYSDISTGLLEMTELEGANATKQLDDLLTRIRPREILCNDETINICARLSSVSTSYVPAFQLYSGNHSTPSSAKQFLLEHFGVQSLSVFDAEGKRMGIVAVARLLDYVYETQKRNITNLKKLVTIKDKNYVQLDISARRNLELVENMSLRKKYGSLLWILDQTKTSMGARKMRNFVDEPLTSSKAINARLGAVEELLSSFILRDELLSLLSNVVDIERRCSKLSANTILPKELYTLADSLKVITQIKHKLSQSKSALLKELYNSISDFTNISNYIQKIISPNAPAVLKDGGYIAAGYDKTLDELRNSKEFAKLSLASLEQSEREKTGIKNLKTGYNRVFGYYIEVTNGSLSQVPDYYVRKQTTTTAERFIIPELKEMEYKIETSAQQAIILEEQIFAKLKQDLQGYIMDMLNSANSIATLDCLISFAVVASKNNYVKPTINDKINHIKIVGGRHPVVEAMLTTSDFVSNDCTLDDSCQTMLITGPNMAGKSTFMRQVAIITLMAHMGSYVPASSAEICIVDRVFTRVGATDELAFGQSTFMVEMNEVASILANATSRSLIILDEVGRGTSTYDGLSIAWAILEYIAQNIKAKTLFSTHYHELTSLEGQIEGIKNYKVQVKELPGSVLFLHKIARGSANKSFGIEVAKLAGLPESVLSRAKQILNHKESTKNDTSVNQSGQVVQNISANEREVLNVIKDLDINNVPPIVAFTTLAELCEKLKK